VLTAAMAQFSHFDEQGESRMVDVGEKPVSKRIARASGVVRMQPATLLAICERSLSKGDVREVARLAGIMAAKRTGDLIPLCHPLAVESIALRIEPEGQNALRIESAVQITAKTGVEMEALTAVSVAALTVYDMCKSIDRGMVIERIQLESKSGGASGTFARGAASCPSGDALI
jgi:cyclic pyranopterin phosphate synthase